VRANASAWQNTTRRARALTFRYLDFANMRNFVVGIGVSILCFLVGLYGFPLAAQTWKNWFQAPTVLGNYQSHFNAAGRTVVVYGTQECPYCQKARAYFSARGIAFADERVEKPGSARERFDALKLDGVPVILIGQHLIHGFDVKAIDYALAESSVASPVAVIPMLSNTPAIAHASSWGSHQPASDKTTLETQQPLTSNLH